MTRSTHQLAAFAAALGTLELLHQILAQPDAAGNLPPRLAQAVQLVGLPLGDEKMAWPALAAFVVAALLGGVAPDIDRSRQLLLRLVAAHLMGGHRHLSHSLLGASLAALLSYALMALAAPVLALPTGMPWLGFMVGYLSHLVMDALTKDGVPLLYPLPRCFGLPPLAALRVRTGSLTEQLVVRPGLLIVIAWLVLNQAGRLALI